MRWLLVVIFMASCDPCVAGTYSSLAAAIIAAHRDDGGRPQPGPSPAPISDECDNCNGTGKVGDGRVFVECPVCNGTGKKTTYSTPPKVQTKTYSAPVYRVPMNCGPNGCSPSRGRFLGGGFF